MHSNIGTIPGVGSTIISPLWAGVCGTDLDIIRRARPETPGVLGHEAFCQVARSGDVNLSNPPGVIIRPVSTENQNNNFGHTIDGIWSTARVVSAAEQRCGHLIPWKPKISGPETAIVEPLAVACYARSILFSKVTSERVLVLGSGAISLLIAKDLSRIGTAVTLSPSLRSFARYLENNLETDTIEIKLRDALEVSEGFDAVIVAVSRSRMGAAVSLAFKCVRGGGIVDFVSSPAISNPEYEKIRRTNSGNSQPYGFRQYFGPNGIVNVTGHRGARLEDFKEAAQMIYSDPMYWRQVISHVVPFEEAAEFLTALAQHREHPVDHQPVLKAVLSFSKQEVI